MRITLIRNGLVAGLALMSLVACSSDSEQRGMAKRIRDSVVNSSAKARVAAPTVSQALAATKGPLLKVGVENRGATAFLVPIEAGPEYQTWATADRRSMTLWNGMLTGTRGLGEDLMSTSNRDVAALISARRVGTGQRVQRYLTPENVTVELIAQCRVVPSGPSRFSAGVLSIPTTKVVETCQAESRRFTNTYLVEASGYVVSARQWLSPRNGYINLTLLRR